ncbi:SH3-like domain-containing protein [Pseudotabrizicola sp. 4114]|uniref:SH3-like domain-containing protein n=1 Tax=Pseudotabrizicola sp. 4114 TaxID=2817731 RepID=UPI002867145F|nr:nitrile hydratase [Pseudorhodobacter sp. 4114]
MLTMFPAEGVEELVRTGGSCRVAVEMPCGFKPGDRVRAVNINPVTHTRLPQYVRGKCGVVVEDRGVFVFPDTNSLLKGEKPQHVYSVVFTAADLWGPDANPKDSLYIDLWEDYIVAAE